MGSFYNIKNYINNIEMYFRDLVSNPVYLSLSVVHKKKTAQLP